MRVGADIRMSRSGIFAKIVESGVVKNEEVEMLDPS
jgi:hypothetical protein